MRLLLSLVLGLFLLSPALAETITIDTSKLTPEQLTAITKVEQSSDAFTPERLNEYAEIGKNVGEGLAVAAREMGVAVNEFAGSGVGKVALFLIVWKVAGGEIVGNLLGIIGGITWFIVVFKLWTYYFNRLCLPYAEEEVKDDKGNKRLVRVHHNGEDYSDRSELAGYRFIMLFALCVISIPGFVMIFN